MFNSKSKNKISIFMILSILTLFILTGTLSNMYLNSKYNEITSSFYKSFDNNEFSNAKNILNNKILSLKQNKLNSDLNNYFAGLVDKTCDLLSQDKISTNDAVTILSEIKTYNLLDSSLDRLIVALDDTKLSSNLDIELEDDEIEELSDDSTLENVDNDYLALGINALNNQEYDKAIEYFKLVPVSKRDDYIEARQYIKNSIKSYRDYLIEEADELVSEKYYTKALNFLSDSHLDILNDEYLLDIENKIASIEQFREEYQGDDSEYTSNAILQSITETNINSLSINSRTEHFVYVNLKEQKTYIYEGNEDNWTLTKTFISSTGLPGKETPKGVFSVTNRGSWFFSEQFNQGGKYWVQFMGDYLFHSLPFDETATTIVDDTIGEPASHGCIRLEVEDAKWLYDNIEDDTKIIIN